MSSCFWGFSLFGNLCLAKLKVVVVCGPWKSGETCFLSFLFQVNTIFEHTHKLPNTNVHWISLFLLAFAYSFLLIFYDFWSQIPIFSWFFMFVFRFQHFHFFPQTASLPVNFDYTSFCHPFEFPGPSTLFVLVIWSPGFDAFGDVLQPISSVTSSSTTNNNNNNLFSVPINSSLSFPSTLSGAASGSAGGQQPASSGSSSSTTNGASLKGSASSQSLIKGDLEASLASLAQNLDINTAKSGAPYKK